ncbi:MAG: type II toxin-antitoxin system RelE/ParE family toxin [Spirochaetales bacterium]|nr:type II toxin-antitoxin system RelE/ParE family toxin [Spirochaetales bacterium]
MKHKYKALLTGKAYDDLRDIYRYIKEVLHNTSSALAIIDEIEQRIMLLEEYPFTGNNAQEHELQTRGYRKLIINNYIALYTVNDKRKEVHIVRVFYGKRDYQALI